MLKHGEAPALDLSSLLLPLEAESKKIESFSGRLILHFV